MILSRPHNNYSRQMQVLDLNIKTRNSFHRNPKWIRPQEAFSRQNYSAQKGLQSHSIKINCKRLPSDFFSNRKSKLSTGSQSQRASARTSNQKPSLGLNEHCSSIPLTPSFLGSSKPEGSFMKLNLNMPDGYSVELMPCNAIPLRKINSQSKTKEYPLKIRRTKKTRGTADTIECLNSNNQFNENQFCDLFNCTFAKNFNSEQIAQPSQRSHPKTGQEKRASKQIHDLVDSQQKNSRKVNDFEVIGQDLKAVLNRKIYGKANEQILTSRNYAEERAITLPPIQSARAKV